MPQGSSHEELLARLGLDVANTPTSPTALFPHTPTARPASAAPRMATPAVPPGALAAAELTTSDPLARSPPAAATAQPQSVPPPPTSQPQPIPPRPRAAAETTGFDPLSLSDRSATSSCSGSWAEVPGASMASDAIIVGVPIAATTTPSAAPVTAPPSRQLRRSCKSGRLAPYASLSNQRVATAPSAARACRHQPAATSLPPPACRH